MHASDVADVTCISQCSVGIPRYAQNGFPLRELKVSKDMDWSTTGVYRLEVKPTGETAEKQVQIIHKSSGRAACVPQDLLKADDFVGAILKDNFSLHLAYVLTKSDSYLVQAFFNFSVTRQLRKRNSEEARVTAAVPAVGAAVPTVGAAEQDDLQETPPVQPKRQVSPPPLQSKRQRVSPTD